MATYTGSDKRLQYLFQHGSGGSGSVVSITPTLSSGTKIANFEIDGQQGSLYAPSGGGGSGSSEDYNTTPQAIGTWIDGSTVYKVVVTGLSLGISASWSNAVATSLNIKEIIDIELYDEVQGMQVNIEQVQVLDGGFRIQHFRSIQRTISRAIIIYTENAN